LNNTTNDQTWIDFEREQIYTYIFGFWKTCIRQLICVANSAKSRGEAGAQSFHSLYHIRGGRWEQYTYISAIRPFDICPRGGDGVVSMPACRFARINHIMRQRALIDSIGSYYSSESQSSMDQFNIAEIFDHSTRFLRLVSPLHEYTQIPRMRPGVWLWPPPSSSTSDFRSRVSVVDTLHCHSMHHRLLPMINPNSWFGSTSPENMVPICNVTEDQRLLLACLLFRPTCFWIQIQLFFIIIIGDREGTTWSSLAQWVMTPLLSQKPCFCFTFQWLRRNQGFWVPREYGRKAKT
jgi:hypothetical protein